MCKELSEVAAGSEDIQLELLGFSSSVCAQSHTFFSKGILGRALVLECSMPSTPDFVLQKTGSLLFFHAIHCAGYPYPLGAGTTRYCTNGIHRGVENEIQR